MGDYYLAVDVGASSGRHILGWIENGRLKTEEVYRFSNNLTKKNGHLCWDFQKLYDEILTGLKRCKELDKCPLSMGIDTWGVDFVLLDSDDKVLGDTVGYRDKRTEGMDVKVYEIISEQELYARNGIQKEIFNSIYQLYAIKEEYPQYLQQAKAYLMTPEYFNFLLTGVKKAEYTISSTSQLMYAETKNWDYELLDLLGYPRGIFMPICMPGTEVGCLRSEIAAEIGYDLKVMLVGSHDTASAVVAVPATDQEVIYISSGTWSLMGVERLVPDLSRKSQKLNFTNEGGYNYRFRYLKNIMGLWMIQSIRHELEDKYSFAELCELADQYNTFSSRLDVNKEDFLSPDNMLLAVRNYLLKTGQELPQNTGELAACIYQSLAECYAETVKELEEITGKTYPCIHIVGGGSNADYLNRLTAEKTGKTVYAGPGEATSIGNIAVQLLSAGVFVDLREARNCINQSFEIKEYKAY
ncbi:MAG: rhamnulokinase [Mobilitalea sp.]